MNDNHLDNLYVNLDSKLSDVMLAIDKNGKGVCFITNEKKLVGMMSDGDVRRTILKGGKLDDPTENYMNKQFAFLHVDSSANDIRKLLEKGYRYVPLVNTENQLVDVASYENYRSIPVMEPSLPENASVYVQECLETNWISSQGKYIQKFERQFEQLHNSRFCLSVSNGSVALHLSLVSLGIKKGDEVLVPNLTFAATINAVIHAGATPVICEVNEVDWNIDLKSMKNNLTKKTKAIIPVHLYGMPCNMDDVMTFANENSLIVVEDTAEAIGSKWKNKLAGTFGDAATFSFFGNKTITTGEGGMISFKDEEIFNKALLLRDHGMSKKKKYWHNEVGYNYRMTNMQAAIGVAQMENFNQIIQKKREIAYLYSDALKEIDQIAFFPKDSKNGFNTFWLYTISLKSGHLRDELITNLNSQGIESRPVFYPINEMPIYKKFLKNDEFKVSRNISMTSISLPSSPNLRIEQINNISEKIYEFLIN